MNYPIGLLYQHKKRIWSGMKWVSVKDRYPEHEQLVKIKIWDDENERDCEVKAIFQDCEDFRSWTIKKEDHKGRKLIAKPTHWMPLPELSKE